MGVSYPIFWKVQNSAKFAGEKLYLMFWNCSWNEKKYPYPLSTPQKKFFYDIFKKLF